MTSSQIRRSFLDFFKSKEHTIVPSASLLPDSPNLLFTNAGMNQFVPIFLGQKRPDVSRWAGAVAGRDTRAADTQKCIRAGGKHNDLEDVGLDTYHHTFFEMLGNWSFGDYFKQEAIEWAWELVVQRWGFPPQRLYATVYQPGPGDPSEFDTEAYAHWERLFKAAGLDPAVHVRTGGKKDNFWMMGDTGPCGPCSELHVDLSPGPRETDLAAQQAGAELVNRGTPRCIEIWNLVFIQFNANPDGTFSPLPARHVDTGMGFERVTSIIQGTKGLTDFAHARISNYETDIFRPLFDKLEQLSGRKYGSTLPSGPAEAAAAGSQVAIDVAFRVIADHIRTLGFAVADGILPSNEGRGYVLRRILRRAVRYGRTLGFHEPFFHKLVGVLADTMGDVFPEIRARRGHVEEVIRVEEEAFNKTLDRGIELFEEEVARLGGRGAHASRVPPSASSPTGMQSAQVAEVGVASCPTGGGSAPQTKPEGTPGVRYSKRGLPHFERPWAKYMVTFATQDRRQLSAPARDIVLNSLLFLHRERRWQLYAACVMPDHVHALFEPQIKEQTPEGKPVFYGLTDLLHSVKSFTAHEINRIEGTSGPVWQKESFDRLIRSQADLEEKFHYICSNPWDTGTVPPTEPYPWLWTPHGSEYVENNEARRDGSPGTPEACAPRLSADFAFKLYDTYGFPLDLTELMARERGMTVDVEGFNRLMEEQRARARAAQKKTVVELSQIETATPTRFVGYDTLETDARVLEVVQIRDRTAVILDTSACYAEMGGQVGDTGELRQGSRLWRIANTQKSGPVWLHLLRPREESDQSDSSDAAPAEGSLLTVAVDRPRREAIQRHHTVTHLLHWALREVVGRDLSQKGSFVGPDKLTFDFNSAPLTPAQVADVERLVNERILEDAGVSWLEVKYDHIRHRPDIMQFFGEKYGDWVRVVQVGGKPGALDGYAMELCGGTHTRSTGQIGLFRIVSENAIATGVRRIEAVAGLEAYRQANAQLALLKTVAGRLNTPLHELDKRIENMLAQLKTLEKQLRAAQQKEAAGAAGALLARAATVNGIPAIIERFDADADTLQGLVNELRGRFQGVILLGGVAHNAVALVAAVSPQFTARVQAGKLIQQIAPLVGGKGGGRPDNARGGGKDVARLDEAIARARALLG